MPELTPEYIKHLNNACTGLVISEDGKIVGIRETHIENLTTIRLAEIVRRLLNDNNIELTNRDPITFRWNPKKEKDVD